MWEQRNNTTSASSAAPLVGSGATIRSLPSLLLLEGLKDLEAGLEQGGSLGRTELSQVLLLRNQEPLFSLGCSYLSRVAPLGTEGSCLVKGSQLHRGSGDDYLL